jgi:hypothetical protein
MWFSARALYRCDVRDGRDCEPLCEESIFIFLATDEAAAEVRAEQVARERQMSYQNNEGSSVEWRLVSVEDVYQIFDQELSDGAEVYSRLFQPSDFLK